MSQPQSPPPFRASKVEFCILYTTGRKNIFTRLSMSSVYTTNQMHNVNYIKTLKRYLRHVSVQECHLQGNNASFENQL